MEPESGAETSAESLHDELTKAFDTETSVADPGSTASAARETASGEPSGAEAPLEAPKHWKDEDKALFGKAPRDVQGRWIARESEITKGFDQKSQEAASLRREREQLDEILSPYERDLQLQGLSKPQFIQSLVGVHKYLQEKPREAVLWLCNQFGVDPSALTASESDPALAQVDQRFTQLDQKIDGYLNSQKQAQFEQNLTKVEHFANAKDEKGALLHPYFDEVAEDILKIQRTGERDLEVAYKKAVRLNDSVYEKEQAAKTLADSQKAEADRKAKIDKAKRAAVGGETVGANGATKPKSLRDDLAAGFENWGQ